MTIVSLELTDDVAQSIESVKPRLPEIIALGLGKLSPIPAQVYAYILAFLANAPTPEQLNEFRPTTEMTNRLKELLAKDESDTLTDLETQELDEYERIEHLIVMLKGRALPYLLSPS